MENSNILSESSKLLSKINEFLGNHDQRYVLRRDIQSLKELRVACILDKFSFVNYAPECNLKYINCDRWFAQMTDFNPDIFFLETAWQGVESDWEGKIENCSSELQSLVEYCRIHHIPVVVWNKEDPVHTTKFLEVMKMGDYVFTTAEECIDYYKKELGHNKVELLHFAAQPQYHNPIEECERKDSIGFAGAYYPRFPERNEFLLDFIKSEKSESCVEIYDRNYNVKNTGNKFPNEWKKYIVGNVDFEHISNVYKGYKYNINLNSVTDSETMFARRVFELMASNTVVLSNDSKGMINQFGDLILHSNDGSKLSKLVSQQNEETYRRRRLRALRQVMREHLYEDRLDAICKSVFETSLKTNLPKIYVYSKNMHSDIEKQSYNNIVCKKIGDKLPTEKDALITVFAEEFSYGENYLLDFALATRYSKFNGYVKPENVENAYKETKELSLSSGVIWCNSIDEKFEISESTIIDGKFLAIDEFNISKNNRSMYIDFAFENEGKVNCSLTNGKFSLRANYLKDIKVAAIMDEFTLESYKHECQLLEVTPTNWYNEMKDFKPDLLFIESAWKGKDGLWYRKIANGSQELEELTTYCHTNNIPVIFWNKEDPIYTDTFMPAAKMADVVFTTELDCVKKYKTDLGHNNVFHLHFAAQPTIHNPIEKYDRKDKFCFAGAYYHRYPQRAEVFDKFAEIFIEEKGFDIYDRNYQNALPEHAFPEIYNPYILGRLEPSDIDVAYKGYNYGINMNSVNQSQTMFARRVFEMLASNTVTVGNYSRGLKNYFGDLTICTDDAKTMKKYLDMYCGDEVSRRKYALLGLRKVLSKHLYEDRFNYIIEKIYGTGLKKEYPRVLILAKRGSEEANKRIEKAFNRQTYSNKRLLWIDETDEVCSNLYSDWIAVFGENNYYGPNYILDMMLSLRYTKFDFVSKDEHYVRTDSGDALVEGKRYQKIASATSMSSIIKKTIVKNVAIKEILNPEFLIEGNGFAVDEFNFCLNCKEDECITVDDLLVVDSGVAEEEIESAVSQTKPGKGANKTLKVSMEELNSCINNTNNKNITSVVANGICKVKSSLEAENHIYVFTSEKYPIADYLNEDILNVDFSVAGNLECIGCVKLFGSNKEMLRSIFTKGRNKFICEGNLDDVKYFEIGIRLRGEGELSVKSITVGNSKGINEIDKVLTRTSVLILTNNYPSYSDLYRNMFVHQRVESYKGENYLCDVMRMNRNASTEFREFEGINVIEGYENELVKILDTGKIDTVCVHFLDEKMWDVLKKYKDINILVWLHGAEIQPWWRRSYNFSTEEELNAAKEKTIVLQKFWKEVFDSVDNYNIKFIFVSKYFAEEIFEDNKIRLPKDKYEIVHNVINTELFSYNKKDVELRKKILSIRPFANNKYANELSVKCIQELSKQDFFNEMEFRIIGNGILFEQITEPIRDFKNVILEKTFLRQDEIAKMHQEYGIFLVPTRMDAQGVSRDEAMSSGLVPVTNAVAAIPEFVDESCGILVPGEDYMKMAEGIAELYHNPDKFLELSKNAAERTRKQCSFEKTIVKEIDLIFMKED